MSETIFKVGDRVRIADSATLVNPDTVLAQVRAQRDVGTVTRVATFGITHVEFGRAYGIFASNELEPADELIDVDELIIARELPPDHPGYEWGFSTHSDDTPASLTMREEIDLRIGNAPADELAALRERIAELEAALTPFANAAEDEGVQDTNRMSCLLLEDRALGNHALIYSTLAKSEFLEVRHLRAAADALKSGKP